MRRRDGAIKLVLTPDQRDLLVESKLSKLFEVFGDEEDALDSFPAGDVTAGIP